jgi:hypothetical protein
MNNMHEKCCCVCKHQILINSHPWNKNIGVGSISETFGWACTVFSDDMPNVAIFSESQHGMCEMFTKKVQNEVL